MKKALGLMGICVLLATGCQRENLEELASAPMIGKEGQARLASEFKSVQVVDYEHDLIYASLQGLAEGAEEVVEFPGLGGSAPLKMHLRRNGVVADGFQGTLSDGKNLSSTGDLGIRTFEGEVEGGGIVALTISPTMVTGVVDVGGETWMIDPAQKYDAAAKHAAVAYREQDVRSKVAGLESKALEIPQAEIADRQGAGQVDPSAYAQSCWQVGVMVHGDYAYYLQVGSNFNTAIFLMVAAVNNSNSRFTPINIHLFVPSGSAVQNTYDTWSSDASTLLASVRAMDNSAPFVYKPRTVTLLYTGRNITAGGNGYVVNLAFQGSMCKSPSYAYGIAETINGFYNTRIQTQAIAIMMGASYTYGCDYSLMYAYPANACGGENPSAATNTQINTHIWNNHGCIYMATGC